MTLPGPYAAAMIDGTDYIVLKRVEHPDGAVSTRREWLGGRQEWRCDCDEYLEIRPLSPRAWCRHLNSVVGYGPDDADQPAPGAA